MHNPFKWVHGRQFDTDYKKLCLYSFRIWLFAFDAYILKYEANTYLPRHKDPVPQGKHYRLNIKLWGNSIFDCEKVIFNLSQFLILFRPDKYYHHMDVETKTIKLSFGFVKYKNHGKQKRSA